MENKELNSPSVNTFVHVQRKFDSAICALREQEVLRKEKEAQSNHKVEKLQIKVQQSAQKIGECQSKIKSQLDEIEHLKKRDKANNSTVCLEQLRLQLEDKNKMIKCLTKRLNIYDEIVTKKQEQFQSQLQREKEVSLVLSKQTE